ncbi:Na/Pi cotransporter family protein [Geomesophilobacter sediminis]|uniref:Na/Pi cotransporter family protein n=1 Tax=Geomesophilobacter sediminis TaxID=2798584 RepID=A0A8J7INW8_9BACT|nr:Na/Pi cotransporter family protein [Geomesophilobacter sediminis]MBJ6723874.1 Na/Pi cotransporter family protein [Geomesophilobacter sediminis]
MSATSWSYITEALGGLALFILGMRTMSEGLQKVAGERLRRLLEKGTRNRLAAPLVGSCLASLLQSGSAASVLVVGFVNAGLLSLYQALGVLLGTGIGTTIVIQFIAFRISTLALPAITLGVALSIFSGKRKVANLGGLLLGAGLVFFGLALMEQACLPLSETALFAALRQEFFPIRLIAVLSGALLTFVIQSGSAAIGVVIALAASGLLSYETAIAMVIGEVAGASIIPLIASLGGGTTAKRAVLIYFALNFVAISLALLFFPFFLDAVRAVSPSDVTETVHPLGGHLQAFKPNIARHLANAHTIFSVSYIVVFLPLIGFFARSAENWIPVRRSESEARPRFIDQRVLKTPTIALAQAWIEVARMGEIAVTMFQDVNSQFDSFDPRVSASIREKEAVLDVLNRDMSQFLITLSREPLSVERAVEIPTMLQLVNDLELIGDMNTAILVYLERKKEERLYFSTAAMDELKAFSAKVGEMLSLAGQVLSGADEGAELAPLKQELALLEEELQQSHLKRLKSGKCSIVAGLLYGDMIAAFAKVGHLSGTLIKRKRGLVRES